MFWVEGWRDIFHVSEEMSQARNCGSCEIFIPRKWDNIQLKRIISFSCWKHWNMIDRIVWLLESSRIKSQIESVWVRSCTGTRLRWQKMLKHETCDSIPLYTITHNRAHSPFAMIFQLFYPFFCSTLLVELTCTKSHLIDVVHSGYRSFIGMRTWICSFKWLLPFAAGATDANWNLSASSALISSTRAITLVSPVHKSRNRRETKRNVFSSFTSCDGATRTANANRRKMETWVMSRFNGIWMNQHFFLVSDRRSNAPTSTLTRIFFVDALSRSPKMGNKFIWNAIPECVMA